MKMIVTDLLKSELLLMAWIYSYVLYTRKRQFLVELYNQNLADYSGWASDVSEKKIATFCSERAGIFYV